MKKKVGLVISLVIVYALAFNSNNIINTYQKYFDSTELSNEELTRQFNELYEELVDLENEKAEKANLSKLDVLATNMNDLATNSAQGTNLQALTQKANQANSDYNSANTTIESISQDIETIATVANNAAALADTVASSESVEAAATLASEAKTQAAAAKTAAATAKTAANTLKATVDGKTTLSNAINKIYPVGSIYLSYSSTNPKTLFGGTWEQLQNRVLIGIGSDYSGLYAGYYAGSAYANISHYHSSVESSDGYRTSLLAAIGNGYSANGVPSARNLGFKHDNQLDVNAYGAATYRVDGDYYLASGSGIRGFVTQTKVYGNTSSAGTSSLDIRQPYIAVYMWRRTA